MPHPPAVPIPIRLRTKLSLILLGLFLTSLLLEGLLRAGGFALLAAREYKNLQAAKQEGVYRIMCIGESTTQDQYPSFLSEILRERAGKTGFTVFDKGVVATNTDEILSRLESDLDECQPDMVITMIGINDWGFGRLEREGWRSKMLYFLKSLRVYKLARYIHESLSAKIDKILAAGDIPVRFGNRRMRFSTYLELARDYKDRGKIDKAREYLEKAIAQDPQNDMAYFELGRVYRLQHDFISAADAYKKLREINPRHSSEYKDLKWVYADEQSFAKAEEVLKRSLMMNPLNDWLLGALATAYEESGRRELAQEYYDRADKLRKIYKNPRTANNYLKLKEIVQKRGVVLVCMQYPMRKIEPLKEIFKGQSEGIIFIDNEKIFREAIRKEGYKEYFIDLYAGDFGHCSDKGNKLIAENVATVILREVFGR